MFSIKYINNLNPVNFKCTYLFDESCAELKNSESLHKMFGFAYGGNYMQFYWEYSKEMNKVYIKAKVKNKHKDENSIQLIYGCDFNESHDYKVEINRKVTSFQTQSKKSIYKWLGNVDDIIIKVDDKIITKHNFYSNDVPLLNMGFVIVHGKGINFYKNKIN